MKMKKEMNTEKKLNIIEERIKELLEENEILRAENRTYIKLLKKSSIGKNEK